MGSQAVQAGSGLSLLCQTWQAETWKTTLVVWSLVKQLLANLEQSLGFSFSNTVCFSSSTILRMHI